MMDMQVYHDHRGFGVFPHPSDIYTNISFAANENLELKLMPGFSPRRRQ